MQVFDLFRSKAKFAPNAYPTLKEPYVFEFPGIEQDYRYLEDELEERLISNQLFVSKYQLYLPGM